MKTIRTYGWPTLYGLLNVLVANAIRYLRPTFSLEAVPRALALLGIWLYGLVPNGLC